MDEWHKTENIYNFALSVLFIYLVADFALALNSARFFIQFYNCNFLLWNVQRWRNPIFFRSVCWVYRKLTIELLCVKDEIKRRQFAIWITNSESISNVEAHALHSHPLFSTRKYLFTIVHSEFEVVIIKAVFFGFFKSKPKKKRSIGIGQRERWQLNMHT